MPRIRNASKSTGTQRGLSLYSLGIGGVYRPDAGGVTRPGFVPPLGVTRPGASFVLLAILRE